jgi:hypothetical protein
MGLPGFILGLYLCIDIDFDLTGVMLESLFCSGGYNNYFIVSSP